MGTIAGFDSRFMDSLFMQHFTPIAQIVPKLFGILHSFWKMQPLLERREPLKAMMWSQLRTAYSTFKIPGCVVGSAWRRDI